MALSIDHNIIFTNSAGSQQLFANSPYRLISINGTGGTQTDIQTQKAPYQDGTTFIDSLLGERFIEMEIHIYGDGLEDIFNKRRTLQNLFNPKLGLGVLQYTFPGGALVIDAVADGTPVFPTSPSGSNTLPHFQRAFINLRCPDPAWRDPNVVEIQVSSFEGGFTVGGPVTNELPMEFDISFGTVGQFATVNNEGDLPTPILAIFEGPVTNPRLDNLTTGEFIAINATIATGERLEINTAFGQKSVILYDSMNNPTNAFNLIDPTSTFFELVLGPNELSYAASGSAGIDALTVRFYNLYVGV